MAYHWWISVTILCGLQLATAIYLAYQTTTTTPGVPGCRRLGLIGRSNFFDLHMKQEITSAICKVKALFIYPLTSCAPVELDVAEVEPSGLRYDRLLTLAQLETKRVDKEPGDMSVSTEWRHYWRSIDRQYFPRLALLTTQIWVPDPSSPSYSPECEWVQSQGCIVGRFSFKPDWSWNIHDRDARAKNWEILTAIIYQRSMNAEPCVEFRIPFLPTGERAEERHYTREDVLFGKVRLHATNMANELPPDVLAKLKYFLGVSNPLALFRIDQEEQWNVLKNAPSTKEAGYEPSMRPDDACPLHPLKVASVHHLASSLPESHSRDLSALRFRANIYIEGSSAFPEDNWKLLRIGNSTYQVSRHTARCRLLNIDSKTGTEDHNELERTPNKRCAIDEDAKPGACLDVQILPLLRYVGALEKIVVGDVVEVIETV
ncbi:hypothetical protein LTR66_004837 [Elasticomyces elasticus]|nr:hypothetical protein LTR50_000854 [Elasticomyces elasticus]KAK4995319.1 hypothetical protein LTR66_004837 [Elasticomyces elasticus]KAK5010453.1 hypothetical protein LTR28_009843 [Elasticomyces elasticus]